VEESHTRQ